MLFSRRGELLKITVLMLKITGLLRSRYKKLLRKFRNATFHPEDYNDERIETMAATGQPSIDWAREVTKEFKRFFESVLFS